MADRQAGPGTEGSTEAGEPGEKTKVAVLGAGMGSIAALYSLTQLPENREKYDITVYQLGWRVGGKGASGRNMRQGGRIEEHGLHIWFGFYDNAFKVMKDAYRELGRPPDMPLHSFETAFTPHDFVVLMDRYGGEWRTPWQYSFPKNDGEPGDGGDLPSFWTMAGVTVGWLALGLQAVKDSIEHPCPRADRDRHRHGKEGWWEKIEHFVEDLGEELHDLVRVPAALMLSMASRVFTSLAGEAHTMELAVVKDLEDVLCTLLAKWRAWLWAEFGCHDDDDTVREFLVLADFSTTAIIGLLRDDAHTKGIFSIDDEDLTEWLTRHGASPTTLTSPIVRALYDNIFAYEGGDVSRPNAAAGTSLLWMIRMVLTYKGHLMYKMNAGMGDTIFTPFHQVLVNRGVKFEFFHCVQNLGLDEAGEGIETVQVMPQVDLTVDEYDPYVLVKGLPCWPDEPDWDQIVDGEKLREEGVNLEAVCTPFEGREPRILRRGEDFDIVILGIPVDATAEVTRELYDSPDKPAWKAMIDSVQTVQTQAYQMWLNEDLPEVGSIFGRKSPVLGTYHELIDTYADMTHLIPVEDQPADEDVRSIAYYCGAQRDSATQEEADRDCYANALENLRKYMPRVWTRIVDAEGDVDWDALVDPGNARGEGRFRAQFFRANWTRTERYTLSVAGSTRYRLKTDATGYDNLYIVGDWIDNNFNSGCIEACTMSGMQASRAICGYPEKIVGEAGDLWAGR